MKHWVIQEDNGAKHHTDSKAKLDKFTAEKLEEGTLLIVNEYELGFCVCDGDPARVRVTKTRNLRPDMGVSLW